MKNLYLGLLCLCSTFYVSDLGAQLLSLRAPDLNRPKLFQDLQDTIAVEVIQLDNILNNLTPQRVNTNLFNTALFAFDGELISSTSKYDDKIRTVIIRSTAFQGAYFTLSRSIFPDGGTNYRGMIIHKDYGDVLLLKRIGDEYLLIKKGFYDVINE